MTTFYTQDPQRTSTHFFLKTEQKGLNAGILESLHDFPPQISECTDQHANLEKNQVEKPAPSPSELAEDNLKEPNKPINNCPPTPGRDRHGWNAALIDVGIYVCHAATTAGCCVPFSPVTRAIM